ncbi:uncharacterized protein [Clytia hemisphaerica]|uniref:uncharacterized protein n=1 Tax=Clytia hemisphaerica TaxID=252671 RepID=UPI0034D419FF
MKFQTDNIKSIKSKIDDYLELLKDNPPSEAGGSDWLLGKFLRMDEAQKEITKELENLAPITTLPASTLNVAAPGFQSNPTLPLTTMVNPFVTTIAPTCTTFSNAFDKSTYVQPQRSRVDPSPFQIISTPKEHAAKDAVPKNQTTTDHSSIPTNSNKVDAWIDELDINKPPYQLAGNKMEDTLATWFVQQGLPRIRIPWFDGTPSSYVEFITSFRDLVHNQGYLTTLQKCIYLHQAVRGEVKRSIQGFRNDHEGYVLALRRIKYMFGQRSRIAESVITKIVDYKPIGNRDQTSLTEFYYTLSDCLVTLRKLNYVSDLYSTDILRQACTKLPQYLLHKWADYCLTLRRSCEPNLTHLEAWLQERILASKDSYLPRKNDDRKDHKDRKDHRDLRNGQGQGKQNQSHDNGHRSNWSGKIGDGKPTGQQGTKTKSKENKSNNKCYICKDEHQIHKCPKYVSLDQPERFEMAKKLNLCYNCLKKDHFTSKCKSKNNCLTLVAMNVIIPRYMNTSLNIQSTLVRDDVAKKLKLKKKDKKITITTINDIGTKTKVKETSMRVENRDDGIGVNIDHCYICYIVPKSSFHMPKQQYPSTMMKKMKEEKGIKLHNALYEEIGILIGANVPSVHIPLEVKEGENSEPLAIKTIFGWTLFGASGQPETVSMNRIVIEPEADLHHCVQRIWDQDFITNPSDRDEALSIEDKRCHEKLESETVLADGKYQVPMLWKKDVTLSNNRTVAEKRFHQLQNKLRREPNLRKLYDQSMTKYLEIGYARKMTSEEAATAHPRTWYLPHYGVFNPNKPGKIRLVFDAAAKFQGTSLNDALYTGPDLLNNMLGVLMRFRTHHFAFSADIEGMFNQVKVNQEDTQSLRFLWKEDIDSPDQPDTYQMLVHISWVQHAHQRVPTML